MATDAIRADTAFILTHLLRGVVERGTAVRAKSLKRPIAGKTGTTNDFTDAWFVGFEPTLAAGVWVGFDEKKDSLGREATGGHIALPIWMEFWKEATKDRPVEDYPIPGNVVFVPVDESGRAGRPGTPGVQMEAFVAGTEPRVSFTAAPCARAASRLPAATPHGTRGSRGHRGLLSRLPAPPAPAFPGPARRASP